MPVKRPQITIPADPNRWTESNLSEAKRGRMASAARRNAKMLEGETNPMMLPREEMEQRKREMLAEVQAR